jgi:paraquat-inducible protein B
MRAAHSARRKKVLKSTETNLVGPGAPAQADLRNAMQELGRAARSLRVLADYLERHPEAIIRGKTAEPAPK